MTETKKNDAPGGLVPEPDAGFMLQRSAHVRAGSIDTESRSVEYVLSSETKDRHHTRLKCNWRLDNYRRNPVALWAHGKEGMIPIGQVRNVRQDGTRLVGRLHFYSERVNPVAEQLWNLHLEGGGAGSVGFEPNDVRVVKEDGEEFYEYDDIELLEFSIVAVGSNLDSLPRAIEQETAWRRSALAAHTNPPPRLRGDNNQEHTMPEPTEKSAPKIDATIAQQLADAIRERNAFETQTKALASERDTLKTRAEAAEAKLKAELDARSKAEADAKNARLAAEVDALVGQKITAAERDDMIELRRDKPELFARLMAQRGTSHELLRAPVLGSDPAPNELQPDNNGEDFARDVNRHLMAG